jgi:hypothetical protein
MSVSPFGDSGQEVDHAVSGAKQGSAVVRGDRLPTENGLKFSSFYPWKTDGFLFTFCHNGSLVDF